MKRVVLMPITILLITGFVLVTVTGAVFAQDEVDPPIIIVEGVNKCSARVLLPLPSGEFDRGNTYQDDPNCFNAQDRVSGIDPEPFREGQVSGVEPQPFRIPGR